MPVDAQPPEDSEKGWKPDPLGASKLRWWDGEKWTDNVHTGEPEKKGKNRGQIGWIVGAIVAIVIVAAIAGSGGEGDDSSNTADEAPPPEKVEAPKASGRCPGQMYVGIPVELNFRVKNPGPRPYPATYFGLWDGSGPFVLNEASSDGAAGIRGEYGLQGKGYQFRGYLDAGESRKLRVVLTPKDAGNFDDLEMGIWGGREDGPKIPLDTSRVSVLACDDITINPGL